MTDINMAAALVVGMIGVSVIGFIIKWAWTHTHEGIKSVKTHADKRIDDMAAYVGREFTTFTDVLERKADNNELTRARDAQVQIFDQLRRHEQDDRNRHEAIISGIGELKGKLDSLLVRKRGSD